MTKKSICKCRAVAEVIVILSTIIFLAGIILNVRGFFKQNILFGNLFICLLSLLALFSMFIVYRRFPTNFPREKNGKLFILISLFLFFLGDLYWALDEVVFSKFVPIGGMPDLFWNIGYWALIVGILFFIFVGFIDSYKKFWTIFVAGLLAGLVYLGFDVLEDISLKSLDFVHFIQDMYFLYDFILIALIIILLMPLITNRNKLFYGWIVLGFGIFTRAIYDILFAGLSEAGTYYTGHIVDLVYVFFYVAVVYSSLIKLNNVQSV